MIRILGAVKYYSQKKTFYIWQPRVVDSSQGRSNTQLDDFDHESFKHIRHSTTTEAETINLLMMRQGPQVEQDAAHVRRLANNLKQSQRQCGFTWLRCLL